MARRASPRPASARAAVLAHLAPAWLSITAGTNGCGRLPLRRFRTIGGARKVRIGRTSEWTHLVLVLTLSVVASTAIMSWGYLH